MSAVPENQEKLQYTLPSQRLPESTHRRLSALSAKTGIAQADLVRLALAKGLPMLEQEHR